MLPVCVNIYLKSALIHKFLILDTYHPYTIYLHGQGNEDPWLFFEAKGGSARKKNLGNTDLVDTVLA
jgi:hypothetical protein